MLSTLSPIVNNEIYLSQCIYQYSFLTEHSGICWVQYHVSSTTGFTLYNFMFSIVVTLLHETRSNYICYIICLFYENMVNCILKPSNWQTLYCTAGGMAFSTANHNSAVLYKMLLHCCVNGIPQTHRLYIFVSHVSKIDQSNQL